MYTTLVAKGNHPVNQWYQVDVPTISNTCQRVISYIWGHIYVTAMSPVRHVKCWRQTEVLATSKLWYRFVTTGLRSHACALKHAGCTRNKAIFQKRLVNKCFPLNIIDEFGAKTMWEIITTKYGICWPALIRVYAIYRALWLCQ